MIIFNIGIYCPAVLVCVVLGTTVKDVKYLKPAILYLELPCSPHKILSSSKPSYLCLPLVILPFAIFIPMHLLCHFVARCNILYRFHVKRTSIKVTVVESIFFILQKKINFQASLNAFTVYLWGLFSTIQIKPM